MDKTMRVGRELLLWIGGALGGLCLLFLAAGWLFNVTPLVFTSGSMSPAYEAGALGIAREVPAEEVAVGDVVSVLDMQGARVTHRVVDVQEKGGSAVLTLKGDTNDIVDAQTYQVTAVDRVSLGVPYAGSVLSAATSPAGLLLGALLAVGSLWVGFGRRDDGGDAPAPRRACMLLPAGVVSAVAVGGVLGATGAAPWAFTSAVWSDTATARATASTPAAPAVQVHAAPSCARVGSNVTLTFANVDAANEYYFEVRERGTTTPTVGEPVPRTGTVGAAVAQGNNVVITLAPGGNGNRQWDVAVFAQLEGQPATRVGPTTTMIRRQSNDGLFCGA